VILFRFIIHEPDDIRWSRAKLNVFDESHNFIPSLVSFLSSTLFRFVSIDFTFVRPSSLIHAVFLLDFVLPSFLLPCLVLIVIGVRFHETVVAIFSFFLSPHRVGSADAEVDGGRGVELIPSCR